MPKGVYGRKDWADRFWEKVDKQGPVPAHVPRLGRCWVWTGSTVRGYGQFWLEGKNEKPHRVSWLLEYGSILAEMILHRCDNRACVRPSHLFEGSHQDNMDDRNQKGRQAQGPRHYMAKGTTDDIDEIRALYATRKYSQEELGWIYNRSQVSISQLVRHVIRKKR